MARSKAFGTYTATVEHDGERGQCYINDNISGASGSLSCAEDTGTLYNGRIDGDIEMSSKALEDIGRWARLNGYDD